MDGRSWYCWRTRTNTSGRLGGRNRNQARLDRRCRCCCRPGRRLVKQGGGGLSTGVVGTTGVVVMSESLRLDSLSSEPQKSMSDLLLRKRSRGRFLVCPIGPLGTTLPVSLKVKRTTRCHHSSIETAKVFGTVDHRLIERSQGHNLLTGWKMKNREETKREGEQTV